MSIIMSINESGSGGIVGRAGAVVGLSLLAWQAPTTWQVMAETAAAVDASGRVVPIRQGAAQPAMIGQSGGFPCAEAAALPVEQAKALVARVAAEEAFYPEFVLSVAKIESGFGSTARSDKGAYGLMQLMPDTAQRFKVDLCDPEGNIRGGIRLLRTLHARYRNPFFILAAYNAGEEAVRKSRGVPPFPETVRSSLTF
jgi:soluble lytic murein transglycosylase-like protein